MNDAATAVATMNGIIISVRVFRMQEQHQHDHRQRTADEDVVLHQVDGRVDVLGFVVDLRELQAARVAALAR